MAKNKKIEKKPGPHPDVLKKQEQRRKAAERSACLAAQKKKENKKTAQRVAQDLTKRAAAPKKDKQAQVNAAPKAAPTDTSPALEGWRVGGLVFYPKTEAQAKMLEECFARTKSARRPNAQAQRTAEHSLDI